jgi:hypothetical protein
MFETGQKNVGSTCYEQVQAAKNDGRSTLQIGRDIHKNPRGVFLSARHK